MQEWVPATCTARRKSHASPLESHADAPGSPRRRATQVVMHEIFDVHHHLSRTPTRRTWRVAIHPVLGDIDIEAAQIDGAKLIERVIDLMELERFVGCSTIANHFIQAFQDPAIDEGHSNGPLTSILSPRRGEATAGTLGLAFRLSPRWGEGRVRGEIIKVSEQDAQGVANPAIGVA